MSLKCEQDMTPFAPLLKRHTEKNYSLDILEMALPLYEKYDRQTIQAEVA